MKHIRTILAMAVLLLATAATASAQVERPPREPLIDGTHLVLRAGPANHTSDGYATAAYVSILLNADVATPWGTYGFALDSPSPLAKDMGYAGRIGYTLWRDRIRVTGFGCYRHSRANGVKAHHLGYGLTGDIRIAGPAGIYLAVEFAHPLKGKGDTQTADDGHFVQAIFSYGISYSF